MDRLKLHIDTYSDTQKTVVLEDDNAAILKCI